jgi:hypothetical protein
MNNPPGSQPRIDRAPGRRVGLGKNELGLRRASKSGVRLMPEHLLADKEKLFIECRVHERYACELASTCRPPSDFGIEATWAATITDISRGGLRLLLHRRFEPGSALAIELPPLGDREASIVFAKVVWVRPLDQARWTLGCKFISELSEEELRRVLPSEERNGAPACQTKRNTTLAPDTVVEHARVVRDVHFRLTGWHGKVRNCLIRSLKVPKAWPFQPGKIILFRIKSNGSRSLLRGEVVECSRQGQGWNLDCRLVG